MQELICAQTSIGLNNVKKHYQRLNIHNIKYKKMFKCYHSHALIPEQDGEGPTHGTSFLYSTYDIGMHQYTDMVVIACKDQLDINVHVVRETLQPG